MVVDEINAGDDELAEWALTHIV